MLSQRCGPGLYSSQILRILKSQEKGELTPITFLTMKVNGKARKSHDSRCLTCCLKYQVTLVSSCISGAQKIWYDLPTLVQCLTSKDWYQFWLRSSYLTLKDMGLNILTSLERSSLYLNTLKILNNRDLVVIPFPLDQNILSKNTCVLMSVTWELQPPLL